MKSFGCGVCIVSVTLALWLGVATGQTSGSAYQGAQNECGLHQAMILDLAERIISEKGQAEGFSEHNFGTAAAYLILRYGHYDFENGLKLMVRANGDARVAPRGLDELRFALAISRLPNKEEGLYLVGKPANQTFSNYSPVVIRQVLLFDAGKSFFRLLSDMRADQPERARRFESSYRNGLNPPSLVLDQSDDFKLRLARNAESAGELAFAAMVLGSRSDLKEYFALLDRNKESDLAEIAGPKQLDANLATLVHQTAPLFLTKHDKGRISQRADQFDIMRAAFRMGGLSWLSILANQIGVDAPMAGAARDFLAEIDAGLLDPRTKIEPAWVFLYERLAREIGAEKLRVSMMSFTIPRSIRHYADTGQTTLDWMIARQALVPFLTDPEAQLPQRPILLSPEFDWSKWTGLASDLRGKYSGTSISSEDAPIAAELFLAKGDLQRALDVARNIQPNNDRLWFYRDVMIRLDHLCQGYTIYPGGELVMGGSILYGFD